MPKNHVELACDRAGGNVQLAKKLNEIGVKVCSQAISRWKRIGYVPPDKVMFVAQVTGMEARDLCPSMFVSAKPRG